MEDPALALGALGALEERVLVGKHPFVLAGRVDKDVERVASTDEVVRVGDAVVETRTHVVGDHDDVQVREPIGFPARGRTKSRIFRGRIGWSRSTISSR